MKIVQYSSKLGHNLYVIYGDFDRYHIEYCVNKKGQEFLEYSEPLKTINLIWSDKKQDWVELKD